MTMPPVDQRAAPREDEATPSILGMLGVQLLALREQIDAALMMLGALEAAEDARRAAEAPPTKAKPNTFGQHKKADIPTEDESHVGS